MIQTLTQEASTSESDPPAVDWSELNAMMRKTFFAKRPRQAAIGAADRDLQSIAAEFSSHITLNELQGLQREGATASEIYDAAYLMASWMSDRSVGHSRYFSSRAQQWFLSADGAGENRLSLELAHQLLQAFGPDTDSVVKDIFFPEWLELDASLLECGELHHEEYVFLIDYIAGRARYGAHERRCARYHDDFGSYEEADHAELDSEVGSYISQLNFGREMMHTTSPR